MLEKLKLGLEVVAVFGAILVFLAHPAVASYVRGHRPRFAALGVVGFFVAHAVAQLATRNQYDYPQTREPFPLTRWAMFAGSRHSMHEGTVHDWRGVQADGSAIALNPARLFLTPNATTHFTKTISLAAGMQSKDPQRQAFCARALDAYAKGLMTRHNRLHPSAPVEEIELWERTFSLRPGTVVPPAFQQPDSRIVHRFTSPES